MKPKVYVETSVISYLASWPSQNVLRATHQQVTNDWWEQRRKAYDLYVSAVVIVECQAGDPAAAADRLAKIERIPVLTLSEEAYELGKALVAEIPLPNKAEADAFHIAAAATNAMTYLLTWNCTHIANPVLRGRIEMCCRKRGFEPPIICTPEQLFDGGG